MTAASLHTRADFVRLENDANALAARLPELLIEAKRVSHTVVHGIHGRRRPGPGETFWQFRPHQFGDAADQIDWRRSASSDRLFVRESEWEAAHTLWLWADRSPSMNFASHLAQTTKHDRVLVLTFALADLLSRGGERVGVLGLMPPTLARNMVQRIAQEMIAGDLTQAQDKSSKYASLPTQTRVSAFSDCVLLSDFLEPIDEIAAIVGELAGQKTGGHLVQVLDPAEETLPYAGRTEFFGLEGEGTATADRVESLRTAYGARMQEHRAQLADLARRFQWSFTVHHTDRPAEETLISLYARMSGRYELGLGMAAGETETSKMRASL